MPSQEEVIQDFFAEIQRDPGKRAKLADAIRSQSYDNIARVISSVLRSIGYAINNALNFVGDVIDGFADLFS
jgi:hypothetical protein